MLVGNARLRLLILLLLPVIMSVAFWQIVQASSYFALQTIEIIGNESLSRRQVEDLAGVYRGAMLLTMDLKVVEQRLIADPRIVSASVQRVLPGRLRISVEEDIGIAVFMYHDSFVEFDRSLKVVSIVTDFAKVNLPIVTGISPLRVQLGQYLTDPGFAAAAGIIAAIAPSQRAKVAEINVADPENIYMFMSNGVRVMLGQTAGVEDRLGVLAAALYVYEQRGFTHQSMPAIDLSGEVAVFRGK